MEQNRLYIFAGVFIFAMFSMVCSTPGFQFGTEIVKDLEDTVEALQATVTAFARPSIVPEPTIPPLPTVPSVPTLPTLPTAPTLPTIQLNGSISGHLSYPSDFIPAMVIVAYQINGREWNGTYFAIKTPQDADAYQLNNLPPGQYWVVSFPNQDLGQDPNLAGGYTQAVLCGLSLACTDHALIPVMVSAGQVSKFVDPSDWYAPFGSFPPNPSA